MDNDKPNRHDVLVQFRTKEIINAAIELFNREGVAGVTMERVAELAGVAKGTLYLYFEDKGELLGTVLKRVLELFVDTITKALGKEGPLRPRLIRANEESIRMAAEHREIFDFVHRTQLIGEQPFIDKDDKQAPARPQVAKFLEAFTSLFQEAMENGEIRRSDPELLTLLYLESLHAVLHVGLPKKVGLDACAERDVHADAGFLIDLFLNGISVSKDKEQ